MYQMSGSGQPDIQLPLLSSSRSGQNVEQHRISQPDILLTYKY